MATSNFSTLNDGETPLGSLISPVPDHKRPTKSPAAKEARQHDDAEELRAQARKAKNGWRLSGTQLRPVTLATKWKGANRSISEACRVVLKPAPKGLKPNVILERLADHSALLYQSLSETKAALQSMKELPQVITDGEQRVPRIYAAAASCPECLWDNLQTGDSLVFLDAIQEDVFFTNAELAALRQCIQLGFTGTNRRNCRRAYFESCARYGRRRGRSTGTFALLEWANET